jgi:hypothetical protein
MTQDQERQSAEEEIFNLRKRMDERALANDTDGIARLQLQIADLQQTSGAVTGRRRNPDARGE